MTYIQKHTNISDVSIQHLDSELLINGWIRNTRIQSSLAFVEIYDGSTSKSIQAISEDSVMNDKIKTLSIGSSISIKALVVKHPKEGVELKIKEILYIGKINDPVSYILNAKKMGLDILR